MNEKIQHIIQDIRSKKEALMATLSQAENRVENLEGEVRQLKQVYDAQVATNDQLLSKIQLLEQEKNQLQKDVAELNSQLEASKNQAVNMQVEHPLEELHID